MVIVVSGCRLPSKGRWASAFELFADFLVTLPFGIGVSSKRMA